MIAKTRLSIALVAIAFSISCAGDEGAVGPVGPAGPTGPQGAQGAQGATGPAGTPSAQGLAAVSAAGTLVRGVNVASVNRVNPGRFTVTFTSGVNVDAGYFVVTPGLTGTCNTMINAERSVTVANSVFVSFSTGGNFIDCAFSLIVF